MAIALGLETLLGNIAAITIEGVQIRDIDEVPEQGDYRTSILFPDPDGFITNLLITRDSQGAGGTALMTVKYTLNYRFVFVPVGSLRNLANVYGKMTEKIVDIIEAFMAEDDIAGVIDMEVLDIPTVGAVQDPAENIWHGCTISLRITEFQN